MSRLGDHHRLVFYVVQDFFYLQLAYRPLSDGLDYASLQLGTIEWLTLAASLDTISGRSSTRSYEV